MSRRADTEDESGDEATRRSVERVKIRQGLDEARKVFERGGDLPKYLAGALIRYEAAFWSDVERRLIAPKLVKQAHDRGRALSKTTTAGAGAFEVAGNKLGMSMSTAERSYSDYPPDANDAAIPKKRGPVQAAKKKGKSSKR